MREDGAVLLGTRQIATTLQCPHCGCHFDSFPGSGKRRTFCLKCSAVTCGNPHCDACVPTEARLEHAEGRRTRYGNEIERLLAAGGMLL